MRKQKLIPVKNIAQINEFLEQGWEFNHMVNDKYVLLSFWQEPRNELGGIPRPIGNYINNY